MHVFRGSNKCPNLYPPWKLKYKRHILGMSTSPRNDYCRLRLCRLSCMLIPSTPHKIPLPGAVLWGICKTLRRNSEIYHGYMLQDTDSRLLFQTWSKSAREMPCCIGDRKKQNIFFAPFCGTPGEISRKFFMLVCIVVPHLYSRCYPNMFRFRALITEKPFRNPKSENNIGFFEPMITVDLYSTFL